MPKGSRLPRGRRESGFSLIVSLLMLIVIIILGISASQMAVNEERGARNDRDRQIAFQAAEAALKDGEAEISGSVTGCPLRLVPAPGTGTQPGGGRAGTSPLVCFNETAGVGFVSAGTTACSTNDNIGLCDGTTTPAYLSSTVDFYGDAKGANSVPTTVRYGQFSSRTFASQYVQSAATGLVGQPIAVYPPRYIIERVYKNVSLVDMAGKYMFRVTAMGFGANPNTQVVLQSIVSTEN
ncbi:MAG: PilX N-terminal domain-containing pilus assembly protein [Burkholderiaceae bacterium]